MSRSVEDIALFRSILLEEELVSIQKVDLSKIKIGFVRTPHWDKTDDSTEAAFEHFLNLLCSDKLNVIDLEIDNLISKSDALHLDISGYEFKRSISHERFNYYDQLSDQLRHGRLSDGYQVSNKNYQLALKDLSILKNQIDAVFDETDLIITPSAPGEALKGLEYTGSPIFNTT